MRAMPKSITFNFMPGNTMRFAGLMSRCTTPWRCECSSAERSCFISSKTSIRSKRLPLRKYCLSSLPSTYSITMKAPRSSSPNS